MRIEVPGQENINLAFGAGGDKTLKIVVAATHSKIKNYDPMQGIMYTLTNPPAIGTVWQRLDPLSEVTVFMNGAGFMYLRKKRYIRSLGPHLFETIPSDDVTACIELSELNMS